MFSVNYHQIPILIRLNTCMNLKKTCLKVCNWIGIIWVYVHVVLLFHLVYTMQKGLYLLVSASPSL